MQCSFCALSSSLGGFLHVILSLPNQLCDVFDNAMPLNPRLTCPFCFVLLIVFMGLLYTNGKILSVWLNLYLLYMEKPVI
uniref:Uncharacterized protein n=1 Tax=Anguilla anguilla TaxID=7936 RepID=A0A0E9STV2_ANGAN